MKKILFVVVLATAAFNYFKLNDVIKTKNIGLFMVAKAEWPYDDECSWCPPEEGVGQTEVLEWEQTSECTLWSYETIAGVTIPVCLQYTITNTQVPTCEDNYACPQCTC